MTAELDEDVAVRLSPDQVAQLAELLRPGGARTVQLATRRGRFAVSLADADAEPAPRPGLVGETLHAASVGEFLVGYPSRGGTLVREGDRVAPGDVLGLLRIGIVFVPVTLPASDPRSATVTRVLATPGTVVGYGTPLFELQRH